MVSANIYAVLTIAAIVVLGIAMTLVCHYLNKREMDRRQDPLYIPRFQFRPRDAPNKQENVFEEHELSLLRTKVLTEDELRELLTTQLDKYSRITCSCSSASSNDSTDSNPDQALSSSSNDKLLQPPLDATPDTADAGQHIINIDNSNSIASCECAITRNYFTPDCSVCLRDFEAGDEVRILECGHYFHMDCVDAWLTKHSTTCPVCKTDMIAALRLPPRNPAAPTQGSQTSAVAQEASESSERGSTSSSGIELQHMSIDIPAPQQAHFRTRS